LEVPIIIAVEVAATLSEFVALASADPEPARTSTVVMNVPGDGFQVIPGVFESV
jgi:hypothetical protein